jgi:ABC-2 type transport system permease protein
VSTASTSFWEMLRPKRITTRRRMRRQSAGGGKAATVIAVGAVFWLAAYGILYRILRYFQGVEDIGDLLAAKLMGLILLTFLGILLLSNIITALSTFFLSKDLELLIAAPAAWEQIYLTKLTETVVNSSWMVALMCVPILVAYGTVYEGGLGLLAVSLLSLLPFFVIAAAVGSALTLLLVRVFPARRAKDIFGVITVAAAGGVVLLIRLLRPESLAKPEGFRNLGEFMALLRGPTSPWLPSEWATDAMMGALRGNFDPFTLLLLWSSAAGVVVVGAVFHQRFYPVAFTRSQEGGQKHTAAGRRLGLSIRGLLRGVGSSRAELMLKDIRVFFRDTTQWSQLILLAVLVVVYIYNIRALPLYSEGVSFFFAHIISFVNVGLAGFVLSAVAARFVLPGVSLEGPTLWLLRSSPLRARDLLWSKYWVGTVPLLVMALILTAGTNVLLKVSPMMMLLSLVTITAVTFALAALALTFGTLFPQFETENTAQIPTSVGGLLFMMAAVALLGTVLVLESWPVLAIFRHRLAGASPTGGVWLLAGGSGLAAVLICVAATVLPLRVALRRIESFEA